MAHTVSDRKRIQRDAESNAEEIAHQTTTVREDLEFAGQVIDIWNSRLAGGRELFFAPTLKADRHRRPTQAAHIARRAVLSVENP
jgi:hypothetical protein